MEIIALNRRDIEMNRHEEMNAPVKINDAMFLQLQHVIEAKRNMLIEKQHKLKKISKQNAFLQEIRNDYLKYNDYIVKQKQDQISALNSLNNYIHDLTRSGNLSKNNIKDAKMEQRKIVKELNSIRYGLDKIIKDTDLINSKSS